jgi:hypothetical protein
MDFSVGWNHESWSWDTKRTKLIMARVLRRPMFRLGGNTDQGIMSGVAPRQGYEHGGIHLNEPLEIEGFQNKKIQNPETIGDLKDLSLDDLYRVAGQKSLRPRGVTPADALIEFGLNVASAEPSGSIFSTAAGAAKEPFQRYSKSKAESEATQYVSQADMFKTLIGAQADVLAAEAEGKAEGKGWLEQWKFEKIPELNRTIRDLSKKEKDGTITPEQKLELQNARDRKSRIVDISPILEGYLNNPYLVPNEIDRLWNEDLQRPEEERKYKTKEDLQIELDAIENLERRYMAKGGRVGYQNAGPVMGQPTQTDQAMPKELSGISYEELRARLPQEVGDEIVRLLANSPEALEDFAVIQTEQDISNFNKKYGVNLVLPTEA